METRHMVKGICFKMLFLSIGFTHFKNKVCHLKVAIEKLCPHYSDYKAILPWQIAKSILPWETQI
jgi:hypothetical protein